MELSGGAILGGDANGDRELDETDLDLLINEIFDGDGTDALSCGKLPVACAAGADANADGHVDVSDLTGAVLRSAADQK